MGLSLVCGEGLLLCLERVCDVVKRVSRRCGEGRARKVSVRPTAVTTPS
jgi:hypothetical protein